MSQYLTEPIFNNQNENSQIKSHNSGSIQNIDKFPVASLRLLDEAIKCQVMPAHLKDKLIRNPNKYSIFYTKFDLDSPTLRKALVNVGRTEEDLNTVNFSQYMGNQQIESLESIIQYFYYITNQYEILKEIIAEKNLLKKEQAMQRQMQFEESQFQKSRIDQSTMGNNTNNQTFLNASRRNLNHTRSIENFQLSVEDKAEILKEKLRLQRETQLKIKKKEEEDFQKRQEFGNKLENTISQKQQSVQETLQKKTIQKQKKNNEQIQSVLQKAQQEEENRMYQQERRLEEKQKRKEREFNARLPEIEKEKEKQETKRQQSFYKSQKALQVLQNREEEMNQQIDELLMRNEERDRQLKRFRYTMEMENKRKAEERQQIADSIKFKSMVLNKNHSSEKLQTMLDKEMKYLEKLEQNKKQKQKKLKLQSKALQDKLSQTQQNKRYQDNQYQKYIEDTNSKLEYEEQIYQKYHQKLKEKQYSLSVKNNDKIEKVQINYAVQIMRNNQKSNKLINNITNKNNKVEKLKFEKLQLEDVHNSLRKAYHDESQVDKI